jgi:hypothetical protein
MPVAGKARIALFDPRGETATWLKASGVVSQLVEATSELSGYDLLIVGKGALTLTGPVPDIRSVRDGLTVIVFEQTGEVLEKRFGFRVAEYGLRQVFPRVPDHPLLHGLAREHLRDWRGEATLLPPRLKYEMRPRHGPTVLWCNLPVTRLWRCGNRGNVASALIEKPARGDFLPVVDGGYALQYSPLLEYREGAGRVLFCQLDVTGRTETDPAAETLARNLLRYGSTRSPFARRTAVYAGDPAGLSHLESAGIKARPLPEAKLAPEQVLILGPGGARQLAGQAAVLGNWLQAGGHLLALGLGQEDLRLLSPLPVTVKVGEHISTGFAAFGRDSLLAGVGPADVHNRDPREVPLVRAGARRFGNGVLAQAEEVKAVFCQLVPWQFASDKPMNLKRTYRRVSFLLTRLLGNLGVESATPLLDRFDRPVPEGGSEQRWWDGFYLDRPEEWDDPYRFFRW